MMAPLALLLVVATADAPAAPAADAPPPAKKKLLVLDVRSGDLDKGQLESLTQLVATRVARFPSVAVSSSSELRQLVELEAQKQAAGCDETSESCLAELAGALGADLVLATRAGKLGNTFVLTAQLFDAKKAEAAGRLSIEGYAVDDLVHKLGPALDEMLGQALGEQPKEMATVVQAQAPPPVTVDDTLRLSLKIGGGAGIGAGVLLAGAGVVPAVLYVLQKGDLQDRTRTFDGTDAQLKQAAQVRRDAIASREAYDNLGRFVVIGGAVIAVLGGGALAGGLFLPAPTTATTTPTEEVRP